MDALEADDDVVARDGEEEEEAGATCKTLNLSLASGTKGDRNTGKKVSLEFEVEPIEYCKRYLNSNSQFIL